MKNWVFQHTFAIRTPHGRKDRSRTSLNFYADISQRKVIYRSTRKTTFLLSLIISTRYPVKSLGIELRKRFSKNNSLNNGVALQGKIYGGAYIMSITYYFNSVKDSVVHSTPNRNQFTTANSYQI